MEIDSGGGGGRLNQGPDGVRTVGRRGSKQQGSGVYKAMGFFNVLGRWLQD